MRNKRWVEDELSILKECYPIGGTALCIENGLDRSKNSIKSKAIELGLRVLERLEPKETWSEEELAILNDYYPKGGVMLCKERGLDLSCFVIHYKARMLGIKVGKGKAKRKSMWSDEDTAILVEYYPKGGTKLCKAMGISKGKSAMYQKVRAMGLSRIQWDDEHLAILKEYYPKGGSKLCIEKGLHHTSRTIDIKANEVGLVCTRRKKWSEEEDAIIREYYPKGGYKLCIENGLSTSRSANAVNTRTSHLGIKYIKKSDRV